ncbi:MAG: hypothetical protein D4S01_03195 [Dehalococcoidia bacterium]|nr:MAG: hypothetical protein D4S01_03195 [Dehalococcoidia bacterium]
MTKGRTLQLSPAIVPGFNADFDGDEIIDKVLVNVPNDYLNDNLNIDLTSRWTRCTVDHMKTLNIPIPVYDVETHTLVIIDLEDFPHADLVRAKEGAKGPIEFYSVMPNLRVLAYDEVTGSATWANVSNWSRHVDREIELVNLSNGSQIITDDDPRAVYGVPADQPVPKLTRATPTEAAARRFVVPYAHSVAGCIDAAETRDAQLTSVDFPGGPDSNLALNWDTGYFLGAMAGDGWWVKRAYDSIPGLNWQWHLSDKLGYVVGAIKRITATCVGDAIHWHTTEFLKADHADRYGDTVRHTATSTTYGAAVCAFLSQHLGGERTDDSSGSGSKRLPGFTFTAPRPFREGMLCGLIDTDGTASVSNAKSKPQLMLSFTSTSLRLCTDVRLLCRTLGISAVIGFSKETSGGNTAWIVSLSTVDAKRQGFLSKLQTPNKRDAFMDTPVSLDCGAAVMHDMIPFPECIKDMLLAEIGTTRAQMCSEFIVAYRSAGSNLITRYTATRLIDKFEQAYARHAQVHASAATWLQGVATLGLASVTVLPSDVALLKDAIVAAAPIWGDDKELYAEGARLRKVLTSSSTKGRLTLAAAARVQLWLQEHPVFTHSASDAIKAWKPWVDNVEMRWASIKSIEKTGIKETGYDLTVPGYETFMSVDGVILSNTMNFHVVVSDKAIEEANRKLLPSKNLRNPANFGTMWEPRQEFLQGLYSASTMRSGRRVLPRYDSPRDVIAAFNRGEANVEDVVSIKD